MATYSDLMAALRKADAAGDTEAAKAIARQAAAAKSAAVPAPVSFALPVDAATPAIPVDTPSQDYTAQIANLMRAPEVDRSTALGDLKAGVLGLQNAGTALGIMLDSGAANANRALATSAEDTARHLDREIADYNARIAAETDPALRSMLEDGRAVAVSERDGYLEMAGTPEYAEHARRANADAEFYDKRVVEQRIPNLMRRSSEAAAIPSNPAADRLSNAGTFGAGLSALADDPLGVVRSLVLRSAPQVVPVIGATAAGGLAGGPVGAAAAGGVTGAGVEAFSSASQDLAQAFAAAGIDPTDPAAVDAFLAENSDDIQKMYRDGFKRGGIIGAFDAISGGVAAKIAGTVAGKSLASKLVGIGAGAATESATEGAGEAAAGYAVKGRVSPGDVLAEAIGGAGMGVPGTAAQMAAETARARLGAKAEQTPAPEAPETSDPMEQIRSAMTAARPVAPSQTPPTAPMPPAQPDPVAQVAATMQPPVLPVSPAAPQPAPPQQAAPAPTGSITRAQVDANPERYEIMDEAEGQGQDFRPTGGQVVIDKQTGQPLRLAPEADATNAQTSMDASTASPANVGTIRAGQPARGEASPQVVAQGWGGGKGQPVAPSPAQAKTDDGATPNGGAALTPEADILSAMAGQVTPQQGVVAPKPIPTAEIPHKVIKSDTAVTPTGTAVNVDYAIVPLESLTASNFDDGRVNPRYPQERQPRDRTDGKSEQQIQRIMRDFDPRQLDQSPTTDNGAPIVDAAGIVESGNGRTMMLNRMYRDRPDLAQAYQRHLEAQGYPVDGVKKPVLVRIRRTDMTEAEIAGYTRDSNTDSKLSMSATEQAMSDAKALPASALSLYRGGDIDAAANREFVTAFNRHVVPENEQGTMVDAQTGAMTQEAIRRIGGAMLAKAYGDADLINKLIEAADNNIKSIGGALLDVSPAWAKMRAAAQGGTIAPQMDQTTALLEAVKLVNRARTEGRNVVEFVKQPDLLSGDGISAMGQRFLALMFRDVRQWTKPAGRDRMVEAFGFYLDEAMKTVPGEDMFGGSANPAGTLDLIKAKQDQKDAPAQKTDDLFAAKAPAGNGGGVRPTDGNGTGSGQQGATGQSGTGSAQGSQPAAVAPNPQADILAAMQGRVAKPDAPPKSEPEPTEVTHATPSSLRPLGADQTAQASGESYATPAQMIRNAFDALPTVQVGRQHWYPITITVLGQTRHLLASQWQVKSSGRKRAAIHLLNIAKVKLTSKSDAEYRFVRYRLDANNELIDDGLSVALTEGDLLDQWVNGGLPLPDGVTAPQKTQEPQPEPEGNPEPVNTFATAANWGQAVLDALTAQIRKTGRVRVVVSRQRVIDLNRPEQVVDGFRTNSNGIEVRSGKKWEQLGLTEADALAAKLGLPSRFEAVPPVEREEAPSDAERIKAEAKRQGVTISDLGYRNILSGLPNKANDDDIAAAVRGYASLDDADPAKRAHLFPTTLEYIVRWPSDADDADRLTHIYAEYRGKRYYLASVPGNPDGAAAEWRKTYPDASIYAVDRADGTSINGEVPELDAAIAEVTAPVEEPFPTTPAELDRRKDALLAPFAAEAQRVGEGAADAGAVPAAAYKRLMAAVAAAPTLEARHRAADAWVQAEGIAEDREHMVVFSADGVPISVTRGRKGKSDGGYSVSPTVIAALYSEKRELAYATHNHPVSSALSPGDLATMGSAYKTLVAVGHDGSYHMAKPGPNMPKMPALIRSAEDQTKAEQFRRAIDTVEYIAAHDVASDFYYAVGRNEKKTRPITRAVLNLFLHRLGVISYSGDADRILQIAGIDADAAFDKHRDDLVAAFRRAGFPVAEVGNPIGDRPRDWTGGAAGLGDREGGATGDAGSDAGTHSGLIQMGPPAKGPAKTGDADLDGALDDIFGDDNDVSGTGTDLERPSGDGAAADDMGAGDVSPAARPSGRRVGSRGEKAAGGNGKRSAASRLPDGDAPAVGTGSNPGADRPDGTDRQPAASGNGGRRNGGGTGRLPADGGGKGNAAGNAAGSTGKLTPAERLAAIRNVLKEDALDFVAGPPRRNTDSDAFRKWFGDSKVVDADGRPLVVYHGTAADFEAFDPSQIGSNFGDDSNGFFFTNNPGPDMASGYATMEGRRNGGNVIPAYVSIQKPYTFRDYAWQQGWSDDELAKRTDAEIARDELDGRGVVAWWDRNKRGIMGDILRDGHDGVILIDPDSRVRGEPENLVVAFRPTQIKSIFNQGTWDATSPYMLREDPATGIDPRKAEALQSIFVGALDGVNVAQFTDRQIFASIILPLRDAGMTRDEVAELSPYLTAFLADLRAGRVNMEPDAEPAPAPIEADDRAAKQAEADKIKVKSIDRANIDATLPLLLPEQRDDVFKVETRFAKPDGHGMMITNGTGTGKSFSGGGVIKRFVQQGKTNILIVAPSDAVIAGWTRALDALAVPVSQLADTKDAGQGVVITTYANLNANNAVASRDWDLVVTDEAQNLMASATGDATGALRALRAITKRPEDFHHLVRMRHADEIARLWPKSEAQNMRNASDAVKAERLVLDDKMRRETQAMHQNPPPRSKVLFLSATPFAYDKTIDYAEGYLFNYPKDGAINGSNQSGRNLFMVQNFGYRIRYHKLTKPEHAVDSAVFERDFHEKMKRDGVLSGRSLQVDVDYDRRFVHKDDADGTRLDEALEALDALAQAERGQFNAAIKAGQIGTQPDQPFGALQSHMRKNFDYLARQQLLEAIKARLASEEIKKHLALGRKVVVFHDFNVGGGLNPFTYLKTQVVGIDEATGEEIRQPISPMTAEASEGYRKLLAAHPWIRNLDFAGYKAPIKHLPEALGKTVRLFNGNVPTKQRLQNLADFNTDGSGVDVLVVQADAGGAGISMHDVTKGHQRVLINLGMPTKPTTTLQQEGRILRVGSQSDAIFRYFTIGTGWERTAFAQRIAERSGTVENLALGNEARDMMNAFIDAYMDASDFAPSDQDGKGGKAKDSRTHTTTPFDRAMTHYFGRPNITGRRDQRDGIDFYPTPEPLALKMVEWAGLRANERVLEPSAGDGAIVRYMPDDVALTFIEPSAVLCSTAQLRAPKGDAKETTFEQHHISNKYHAIVMNPPFGSGGKTAMDHLAKAAKHLRPGGRLVALIPSGPSADKRFDAWWNSDDAKDFNWTADIALPAVAFERAGTGVMTRVAILDKISDTSERAMFGARQGGTQQINLTEVASIEDFFNQLERYDVPRRPDQKQDVLEELEAEGHDATTPVDTRRPGPPLAAEIGSFEKTTVTSKNGKVYPAAHHTARVERDVYDQMKAAATALNGWWHKNAGAPKGAGPTFAFRTEAARDAFLDDMRKPTVGGMEETAYHGTPHDFDRFSLDNIGTGEGVQAYGWGLYKEQRAQMTREAAAATEEIRNLMPKLRTELDRLNLKRVRLSQSEGKPGWQGMLRITGDRELEIVIGASLDPLKALHHEVIHALRAMTLFTDAEWKALTLAAERKWLDKHDIAVRYSDLSQFEQIEEAIAEEFSEALAAKQAPKGSILVQAFNKIARVFRALRNVLNGAGFQTTEDIFGRVLAGEIGARRAENTGTGVRFQRKGRDTDTGDLFAQPEPARPSGMTADQRRELEARQRQSKIRKTGGNSGDAGPLFNDDKDLFGQRTMFQRAPLAVRPLTPQARAHRNSAMGATPFVPDRRIWETLTAAGVPIWQRLRDLPGAASDAVDRARYTIQDRMLPFLRAQEAVMRQTGKTLPKEHDAYSAETTFSGKVGQHLLAIDEEYTKPIIEIIAASKGRMTADSVGQWLYARHAIERNSYIASINPNMPDGGSGMDDADANLILQSVAASPDAADYQRIGDLIDALRERNLKLREDAGLISNADANLWRTQYKHYVPMKGFEETDHYEALMDLRGVTTGRRFSIRGGESRRALGRQSEAFNPLISAITQAQEVAIRAEKNRVAQAMYELAANYPSKALWEVKKPKQKRYFNRTTGLVETRVENPVTMVLEPNEMAVKIDGHEHRILFNDQRLAESAGTLGADQMGAVVRTLSMLSRFFSITRTMLNPEFMVTNAFRDFQAAQFNIQAFGEGDKARIAAAMAKNWRKAFMGAMRGSTYRFDTEWSRYYREFQKAGAQVWFWTMEQPEAAREDLDRRIRLARGNRAQRALKVMTTPSAFFSFRDNAALNFIERTNLAVDNAIRLAAFVEARRAGWSVEKAAFLAKELTVNFNRRGEAGAQMNALYPFFNAAVQGTARTIKAISSRRVALMVLTAFAAGALNDLLNAALSEEDDDGELFYDKVPDYRNERNFHLVLWGTGDNPFAIPMPYGYNVFPYAGQQLGKVIRGVKDPEDAFGDVARATFGAFTPMNAATPAQMISPVIADPIVEMSENKNWLGSPIYPEDYGNQSEPDAYVHFKSATEVSKWVAQTLNDLTGGDFREPGAVDVSPETLDHLAMFVTGSAGAFWGRTTDIVAKALQGDFASIEARNIPFVRNVKSPIGDWADRDRFYRFSAEVKNAQSDKKAYEAAGVPVPAKTAALATLYEAYLAADREIKGKGEWNPSKTGSLAAREQSKVYLDFNGKYLRVMGKQGE